MSRPAMVAAMARPDLNLLVTLDVLLAEGSVARAARRLRLSPSAMSRALARLRTATGDPLLVRAGRGLVVCLPAECRPDEAAPFDVVLRAERTTVVRAGGIPDVAETAVAETGPAGAEAVPSSEMVSSSTEPVRDRTRLTPD